MIASKYNGILAKFYDADHAWRDYDRQTQLVCRLFPSIRERKKIRILDIACGSGSHSVLLAKAGFDVTGIDISNALLRVAKGKAQANPVSVRFLKKDIFASNGLSGLEQKFDCALLLGWTLNIAVMFQRFRKILRAASVVLKDGGLLIVDAAMGFKTHPVPKKPLCYTMPDRLEANLTISEIFDQKNLVRKFTYDWSIFEKDDGHIKKSVYYRAKENLAVLDPAGVRNGIKKSGQPFTIQRILAGYDLNRPFRTNDSNMVLFLEKGAQ